MASKCVWTLNLGGDYAPEITCTTYPHIKKWADKIDADFRLITERKWPEAPATYEKLQLHWLGEQYDWNIYIDSDTLCHPDMFDPTRHLHPDCVMQYGSDLAGTRWKDDKYFRRDTRQISSCFPAGTIIAGAGPIETLQGGTVKNREGDKQKITAKFSRLYTGELVTLKIACLPKIEVTAEHEILASSMQYKYRRNKKATSGPKAWNEPVPSEPRWVKASALTDEDWVLVPRGEIGEVPPLRFNVRPPGNFRVKQKEVVVPVDTDIAWLLGLYVAEGYSSKNGQIHLSLSIDEDDLAERAVQIFRRLGLKPCISRGPSRVAGGVQVVIAHCPSLAVLFSDWCGRGAPNKKVPQAIMKASTNIKRAFLEGLIVGDGCLAAENTAPCYRLVTVSRQLAFEVVSLYLSMGINASAGNPRKNSPTILGRTVNTHPVYEINCSLSAWNGEPTKRGRKPFGHARFIGNYVYLPVRSVDKRFVTELPVFNLETEDHTYGVPFIVHNCNWFTVASKDCLDLWHPLEDMTVEQALKNIRPQLKESQTCSDGHLIDDYVLSRNIARYGLHYRKFQDLLKFLYADTAHIQLLFHTHLFTRKEKAYVLPRVMQERWLEHRPVDAEWLDKTLAAANAE